MEKGKNVIFIVFLIWLMVPFLSRRWPLFTNSLVWVLNLLHNACILWSLTFKRINIWVKHNQLRRLIDLLRLKKLKLLKNFWLLCLINVSDNLKIRGCIFHKRLWFPWQHFNRRTDKGARKNKICFALIKWFPTDQSIFELGVFIVYITSTISFLRFLLLNVIEL